MKIVKQLVLYGIIGCIVAITSAQVPQVPWHPALVGLAAAILLRGIVFVKGKNAKKYRKNAEYGSARWGTPRDIKPYVDPVRENNIILTASESLTMNSRPKQVKHARNKNVLVIGGSGSGKTRFFVTPNLMQCQSKDYPTSFVCTDPKGQLLTETGQLLERNDYRIKVLNTIDFSKSMRYNPFQYIRSEKDILKFVTALIANTQGDGKSSDPFWLKAETLLYQALIGYIIAECAPDEQNMTSLVEMINTMEVRENQEDFRNPVDFLFETLEEREPEHFAVRQYKKYKLAAGKTAKSILISCGARLSPFDIGEVRELMQVDELDLGSLGEEKTALFVIVSDTDDSMNFIPAIMYSQLFNLLCDKADNDHGGRLPVHVRFLLDEFPNLGKIPKFEKLIATIRSREISACVILQTQSQLKSLYKDDMETITGNMDSILFLGGKEKSTLEEISKMLGRETIDQCNTSRTRGGQESHGQSYQKLGRELMTVDELAVMDGAQCILQIRGERPFKSRKYDLTKHPNYKYIADFDPNNRFDVEHHLSTELDLKGGEVYEFFDDSEPNYQ
ncbi:MAG: type IV secretory system conjugative DNA transfer family protein [Oscillospiraceae bacterium]|nr:type IV secretory system conjugative DNA transfer family protein [Oscillospiraceae bacterium]